MAIETAADRRSYLRTDLAANGLRRWTFAQRFRRPEVLYLRLLRNVEYLRRRRGALHRVLRFYLMFRLMRVSVRTGISIPPGVCGPGLSIAHYGSIVVNSHARIGAFCRINSATNIGLGANNGVPTLGDFVYIGPGAVLYGDIVIGDRVVIGANAVVGRDVPDGVTVAGVPAQKISDHDSSGMMPSFISVTVKERS